VERGASGREETRVLVVGAGPTGLAAANLLGGRGVACLVAERELGIHPLPRAVHFDDEVFRVLQAAGLGAEAAAISRPILGMQILDAGHRVLAELQRDPRGGLHGHPESNFFDQPALEGILRRGLERFPHVELREGTEVEAVEQGRGDGPKPVRATLRDRASGALREVWADAVLACDGARSRCRSFAGAAAEDLRFEESWLVVDVHTPEPLRRWDGCQQLADPRRPATYVPVGGGRYRWEFMLMPGDTPAEMLREARVAELVAPWLGGMDPEKLEIIRRAVYTFHALVARPWRRGRLLLLGDAAHQTPPFLGQGMCAGFRDAANLAWKLALVLEGRAGDELLDSYEAERSPHVRRVIQMAVFLGRTMMGGGPSAHPADRLLRAALRLPLLAKRLPKTAAPALAPGPLVLRRRWRGDGAGLPLPQPEVAEEGGAPAPFDERLGSGFAVVFAGPDPAAGLRAEDAAFWAGLATRFVPAGRSDVLVRWLRAKGGSCALVRPDRIVAAVGRSSDLPGWAAALRAAGIRSDPSPG